ncbi:sodium:proton antiporter, partial [Salmonella enterica subsp. enterica serovar London]|nr:sodium:proton antiporter [Salmonella enterica subsp. enterica serovar London]
GTIGIVLITMARAGSIPENIVAGAIIAGAYFGDRNGPLSSSASLVAALTHTKVSTNIPIMFKDGIPALIISTVLYLLLSQWYPLNYENSLLS